MQTTQHTIPIKSGWPSFDVKPPAPTPHWSYDPEAAKRLARVSRSIDKALRATANEMERRRRAMLD